jgi:hypothetical protein
MGIKWMVYWWFALAHDDGWNLIAMVGFGGRGIIW